ncbi:MAG: amidohydrolase family protein [Acidimicrobiales bacterium]|jgi:N-acyl-D-aspartate/D-glutamate deacylase|nr:amidohydrolase family protein [Actinomycetes bacterium]MDP6104860.1 amidohydrolase family protein [Acidimicrobiales bacterium]MCP4844490.1 amidohydrolase family protein [Actinomycetes bacterium]MDP6160205.1 amidohydrolase family protein [Acidimicrobiales bacterium]MDP7125252.1 amidohydrolase family protein [Acidimicrobiales bacterium]|tara:strand:+ start:27650 stop:29353 length:1704 start_codon:yes stop_codon:yes gene_type:complete
MTYDLVIRGGTVVDGTGVPATTADVAIDGDRVVEVGRVEGSARRELDADGLIVTPGFVDIHTHLDAQLSWDPLGSSSCWHGVTSVVLGNCGVTFAPVAPDGREFLAEMMESVEDVPAQSILDGLSWNWETYGEYLADLASLPKGLNVGGMVGHCAVRVAAMGERSLDEDPASAEDIAAMVPMVDEALAAGALGFSSSRTFLHRVPDGRYVPGTHAAEDELLAFADSLGRYGGIFECAAKLGGRNDPEGVFTRDEIRMYGDISRRAGCPVTFGLTQVDVVPDMHLQVLDYVATENADGARIRPQTTSRQIGILFGLSGRTPFDRADGWDDLRDLSLDDKVARLTEPSSKAALVEAAEARIEGLPIDWFAFYPLPNDPVRHDLTREESVAADAERRGVSIAEAWVDLAVELDGRRLFTLPFLNQRMESAIEMLERPEVVMGLADAGAHAKQIMDASQPTFFLSHWVRDRGRVTIEEGVRRMTSDTADLFGITGRGRLVPGAHADVNVIDLEGLRLHYPEMAHDFPGGAGRWVQRADGYDATIVNGEVFMEDGEHTGALAGQMLLGSTAN